MKIIETKPGKSWESPSLSVIHKNKVICKIKLEWIDILYVSGIQEPEEIESIMIELVIGELNSNKITLTHDMAKKLLSIRPKFLKLAKKYKNSSSAYSLLNKDKKSLVDKIVEKCLE
jgi:hypothetical protein